jgi:hypothetical protein
MADQSKGIADRDNLIDVLRAAIVAALMDLESCEEERAAKTLRAAIMVKVPS